MLPVSLKLELICLIVIIFGAGSFFSFCGCLACYVYVLVSLVA